MNKFVATLILFAFSVLNADWVSISEKNEKFTLVHSDRNTTEIVFSLDGFETETIIEKGTEYTKITYPLPYGGSILETGQPDVPVFSTYIAIPHRAEIVLSLEDPEYEYFSDHIVYPAQHLQTESKHEDFPFAIDPEMY